MNTCPVYRRSGGHSYESSVPGPIGSILAPARDAKKYHSLPSACSLCGSCTDVCPVKIDLHQQLFTMRRHLAERKLVSRTKRFASWAAAIVFRHPWLYRAKGRAVRILLRLGPRWLLYNRWNPWGRQREMPTPPRKAFRETHRTS